MKNKEIHITLDRLQGLTLKLALERLGKAQPQLFDDEGMKLTDPSSVSYREGWYDCFEEIHLIAEQLQDEIDAKTTRWGRISLSGLTDINKRFRGN